METHMFWHWSPMWRLMQDMNSRRHSSTSTGLIHGDCSIVQASCLDMTWRLGCSSSILIIQTRWHFIKWLWDVLHACEQLKWFDWKCVCLIHLSPAPSTIDHAAYKSSVNQVRSVSPRCAPEWFGSYLLGRSQRVIISGYQSERFNLKCGIPLLFSIYTYVRTVHCPWET